MSEIKIFDALPEEEILAQMAEECVEASKASWMTTTPAICVMRSATGWSRLWSRSSPAGSTV